MTEMVLNFAAAAAAEETEERRPSGPVAVRRRPGEPAPDLLDYRVVHRAMTVDADRLAAAAAELVERHDPARLAALRQYLRGVAGEVESHHHVEDEDVWPVLEAVAGERTALVALTDEHHRLDPLLERAQELAAAERATPELAATMRELADLLARHVAEEERDVFPIITDHVRVEDYRRLQRRFRGNLRPRQLAFVVPWVVRHAAADERGRLLADAGAPMRVVLRLTERRFRVREELLFGPTGLSRRDRRRLRIMHAVSVAHLAVLRRTGGRVGGGWFGKEVVQLTVTGRRTGRPHTVPLMALRDGDDLLVAASQAGVDREPQWWLNLLANPHGTAEVSGERFPVVAEEVGAQERPALWARFVEAYAGFAGYQAAVRREIAVVRLRRTG